jgi:phenylacetate-coenzyme A ligase PaaK-like adenylate-forming protein
VQLYGELYQRVLFPAWGRIQRRPTLEHLRYLEQSQWRSADEIAALQSIALRRLLRHAHAHVPFYRDRFEAAGIHPTDVVTAADLQKLPLLTREEAQESSAQRRSLAPPFASITKRTSGSTGQPLEFAYDAGSEWWRQAVRMRGYGWAGYRQGDRTLHYWGLPYRRPHPKLWWRTVDRVWVAGDRGLRREYWVDSTVRSEERLAHAVEVIRRKRPSTIVCYAQAGVELARYVVATAARSWLTIPVLCGAEPLLPGDREVVEQAFGPAVFDTYGNREVMLIASECEAHQGLHVQAEHLVVELVVRDEATGATRAAAPGEVGEIVLTDLHNFAMPFIRYVNGDLATAADGTACPCGRGLPRIASVEGRTSDTLEDGHGRKVGGMTLMIFLAELAPAVRQYQVVQWRDRSLTLRLVAGSTLDASIKEEIHVQFGRSLPGVPVTIEVVDVIEPAAAGKRRFIVVERD